MRSAIIPLVFMVLWAAGCERAPVEGNEGPAEVAAATLVGEDYFTRSEIWPESPERLVSMAPNITEILFALGLGDRVVAVTRYCDWPPEVEDLPKIGGMLDPDYEAILAAEPDVVFGVEDGADHQVVKRLQNAGVAYGFVVMDDLATIRRGIMQMGEWLDVEEKAADLRAGFDERLTDASRSVRESLDTAGASALLVFDQEPIVAAGAGSFGDELLTLAGLENVLGDDGGSYPILDMEKVLSLDPEVVIDVSIGPSTEEVQRFWSRFNTMKAVRGGKVLHIDDPVMMRPGPRLPTALERLGEAVEAP